MTSNSPSSLYFLPRELIDKIIFFISRTSSSTEEGHSDMLAITAIERIGGAWMESAERRLFREIVVSMENLATLELLAQIKDDDKRLGYIREVSFTGSPGEYSMLSIYVQLLSSLLTRASALTSLELDVDRGVWNQIQPILLNLKELTIVRISLLPHESDRGRNQLAVRRLPQVPLSELPAIPKLEKLVYHNDLDPEPEDILDLLKGNLRLNLKTLILEEVQYEEVSPLLHLWPNLEDLSVEFDEVNILSSLPASLIRISFLNSSSSTIDAFKNLNMGDRPFNLKTLDIYCEEDDYSFLPFLPFGIKRVELMLNDIDGLIEELESFKPGELRFETLHLWDSNRPKVPETIEQKRRIEKEAKRLGIKVEGYLEEL